MGGAPFIDTHSDLASHYIKEHISLSGKYGVAWSIRQVMTRIDRVVRLIIDWRNFGTTGPGDGRGC